MRLQFDNTLSKHIFGLCLVGWFDMDIHQELKGNRHAAAQACERVFPECNHKLSGRGRESCGKVNIGQHESIDVNCGGKSREPFQAAGCGYW